MPWRLPELRSALPVAAGAARGKQIQPPAVGSPSWRRTSAVPASMILAVMVVGAAMSVDPSLAQSPATISSDSQGAPSSWESAPLPEDFLRSAHAATGATGSHSVRDAGRTVATAALTPAAGGPQAPTTDRRAPTVDGSCWGSPPLPDDRVRATASVKSVARVSSGNQTTRGKPAAGASDAKANVPPPLAPSTIQVSGTVNIVDWGQAPIPRGPEPRTRDADRLAPVAHAGGAVSATSVIDSGGPSRVTPPQPHELIVTNATHQTDPFRVEPAPVPGRAPLVVPKAAPTPLDQGHLPIAEEGGSSATSAPATLKLIVEPSAETLTQGELSASTAAPTLDEACGGHGCGSECGTPSSHRGCKCCSTCDMYQHRPYFPPMHGYYYFHPYHPSHVARQQAFAASFGGDPRNPYSNDVFKNVYADYKAEHEPPLPPAPGEAP